tara:strand:- start:165 stop:317 length:153 start_codon:yes stop_codon:yes gene_type:complete
LRDKLSIELKTTKLIKILEQATVCKDREKAQKLIKKADKVSRKLSALSDF